MAISISKNDGIKKKYFTRFTYEESNQLVLCFDAFNKINKTCRFNKFSWYRETLWNLILFQKASNKIDLLEIDIQQFMMMKRIIEYQNLNLIVDHLCVENRYKTKMVNESYEIANKINPKIISVYYFPIRYFTFENIKALPLLNCTNVNVNPIIENKNYTFINLSFLSTTIWYCDSKSDQILNFEWESVTFGIGFNNFIKIKLFETSTANYLVIPFEDIEKVEYSGLKAISSTHELNKQFANLDIKQQEEYSWLIVDPRNLIKVSFGLDEDPIKLSESSQQVFNQIMKARHIDWIIQDLRELLEVNKLIPDHFSRINFIFFRLYKKRDREFYIKDNDKFRWQWPKVLNNKMIWRISI